MSWWRGGWLYELGGPKLCFDPHPDLYWRGCVGLFGAVRVSYSSLHLALAPFTMKAQFVKVNVDFFQRRQRWGKADWLTTAPALCAIYNNTSSRCPANQSGRGAEGDQVQVKFPRKSLPRCNFWKHLSVIASCCSERKIIISDSRCTQPHHFDPYSHFVSLPCSHTK